MSVYVNDERHAYRGMIMCHMWADTHEELLQMADAIGVYRRWIQEPPKGSWVYLGISLAQTKAALSRGAILTDRFGPVEHVARLDLTSGDAEREARGAKMLATIGKRREGRGA